MKFSSAFLVTLAGLGIAAISPEAAAMTRHVNCDAGQTITDAIEKSASRADTLEIIVEGTCEENVVIGRDYVVINGGGTAVIVGVVRISEESGIRLQDLMVTGPGDGVVVSLGGSVLLQRVRLVENEGSGLVVHRGSFARLNGCEVSGNGEAGVSVAQATLNVLRSTFSNNMGAGIEGDVGANVLIQGNEISGNAEGGIALGLHSVAEIGGTAVSGNTGFGAYLAQDSGLRLAEGTVFSDSIFCADRESSFSSDGADVTGPVDCSSFDE